MKILDELRRRLSRLAVPYLTETLILGQVLVYVAVYLFPQPGGGRAGQPNLDLLGSLQLVPAIVLEGEIWRVVTFLFVPPVTNLIFAFFFWYLFYLMGTTLETQWGTIRYNLYLLVGFVATVAASFLTPLAPTGNAFLQGSVFLAFAFLYPNFVLHLFLILPIRIKWLALLAWIGYFFAFTMGTWPTRLTILASLCNFLMFFGRELVLKARHGYRSMAWQARQSVDDDGPRHRCEVCGITEQSHPGMDFRYCSKCAGTRCYCQEHLRTHEHVTEENN